MKLIGLTVGLQKKNYKRIYKSVDKKKFKFNDILNEILILTKKY